MDRLTPPIFHILTHTPHESDSPATTRRERHFGYHQFVRTIFFLLFSLSPAAGFFLTQNEIEWKYRNGQKTHSPSFLSSALICYTRVNAEQSRIKWKIAKICLDGDERHALQSHEWHAILHFSFSTGFRLKTSNVSAQIRLYRSLCFSCRRRCQPLSVVEFCATVSSLPFWFRSLCLLSIPSKSAQAAEYLTWNSWRAIHLTRSGWCVVWMDVSKSPFEFCSNIEEEHFRQTFSYPLSIEPFLFVS